MNRITLFCLFFLTASGLYAQSENEDQSLKYFNKTEGGVSFDLGSFKTDIYNGIQKKVRNDEIVITLQTINRLKYMDTNGICFP